MSENILAEVKKEGDNPFVNLDTEKETPSDSPNEKEPKVEEPSKGDNTTEGEKPKDVPFHEHPRWKEREEELKELRAFKEEVTDKFQELEKPHSKSGNIPDWFKELYGENEVAWQKYEEHEKVDHIADNDFTLSDADGFNQNDIKAVCFTKEHRFFCFPVHTAKLSLGRRGADKGARVTG